MQLRKGKTMGRRFIDLTGQKFFRLTVIKRAGTYKEPSGGSSLLWLCECQCGREMTVRGNSLRRGLSRSCGCLRKETAAAYGAAMGRKNAGDKNPAFKHGHTNKHGRTSGYMSPTYMSWFAMGQRCLNPNHVGYPKYGGATPPVTVCDRWLNSFENFLADLGERSAGKTLGRFNDIGNYEPGNCKFMTWAEQVANRRSDRIFRNKWTSKKKIVEQIAA
jgi:hypothetical protein